MIIDAKDLTYKDLNAKIRTAVNEGVQEIVLNNINGQRYIGDNLGGTSRIVINGIPGQDLAFTMDGPEIMVNANAQDGVGNTMGAGKVVIQGNAGDICGYAMRGGKIFIKGNVGYRSGIHMKEYKEFHPTIVVGGYAGDFFGEYMAGGVLVVLGLGEIPEGRDIVGNFCATGMHGGKIYIRGTVPEWKLSSEVTVSKLDQSDIATLTPLLEEYAKDLKINFKFKPEEFIRLSPSSSRPYGRMYAY